MVRQLQAMAIEVHILSGDSKESVALIGERLGINPLCLHGEMVAAAKKDWMNAKKEQGPVMMIGDGLNDVPCLQAASVGVSINAKSELNLLAADVIALKEDLGQIVSLLKLVRNAGLLIKVTLG